MSTNKRSVVTSIVLSIVTCGIYSLFWLAGMINDTCDLKGKQRTGGRDILLGIITCGIYFYVIAYKLGSDIDDLKCQRGMSHGGNGVLFLILNIFGLAIITYGIAQHNLNELC